MSRRDRSLPKLDLSLFVVMGFFLLLVASLAALGAKVHAVTLTVSPSGGNASSPLLYGIMFEVSVLVSWS